MVIIFKNKIFIVVNMQGGIIQLLSNESDLPFENNTGPKHSTSIKKCSFDNNKLLIPRVCDSFIPQYIKSDNEIKYVVFKIGHTIINLFPVEFCNKLQNFNTKQGEDYVYKLNWKLFCEEEFYLFLTRFHTVEFRIISEHNCNSTLYYKAILYDDPTRNALISTATSILVKCFDGKQFKINQGYNSKQLCFHNGKTNGIFIDKININEVNYIKILVNNCQLAEYDNFILKNMVKKIGSDIIYLDLANIDYSEFNYNGSLNLSRISSFEIQIDSNIEQNINIFYQKFNVLKFDGGMTCLHYCYDNNFELFAIKVIEIKKKIEGDIMCLIGLNNIKEGDKYQTCGKCKKNYLEENIKNWLNNHNHNNCPHCNCLWNFHNVYINE